MRICIVSIVMFSTLTTNASSHAQVEVVVPRRRPGKNDG
jgi:hypothetical protein